MAALSSSNEPQQETFPWEAPPLTGPFWDAIPDPHNHLARSAGHLFTQSEFDGLGLNTGAAETQVQLQLQQLHDAIEAHTPDSTTPAALPAIAFTRWHTRSLLLASLERSLGRDDAAESRLRGTAAAWATRRAADATDTATRGAPQDVSALNNLAFLLLAQGRWADAEAVARELQPALAETPGLGAASPQALGNLRLLVEVVGRQGRWVEAERLCREGDALVKEMGQGRFAKYATEEREAMDEVKADLETRKAVGVMA